MRVGRIGDGFGNTEHKAEKKDLGEGAGKASCAGGRGPKEKSAGVEPVYVPAINELPGKELRDCIRDGKRAQQRSEFSLSEMQLALQALSGDSKIPSIGIVDTDRDDEEQQGKPVEGPRLEFDFRHCAKSIRLSGDKTG